MTAFAAPTLTNILHSIQNLAQRPNRKLADPRSGCSVLSSMMLFVAVNDPMYIDNYNGIRSELDAIADANNGKFARELLESLNRRICLSDMGRVIYVESR